MLKYFTAQNFDGDIYKALDFNGSSASLFIANNGDISVLKRLIQLMWASTAEDGIGLSFSLNSIEHQLTSTSENIYLDNNPINLKSLEGKYNINLSQYSKEYIITYTQLLNMELGRVEPYKYLNKYIFTKPESKSYYSPIEDIFYDIEQARKYSENKNDDEDKFEENKKEKVRDLQNKIKNLEELKSNPQINKDNSQKLNELEELLDNQRKQNEFIEKKEFLERDLNRLNSQIRTYEEELKKVSEVDMDMEKYNNFLKLNPQKVEQDLAMFTYRIREREKIFSDLANNKVKYRDTHSSISWMPAVVMIVLSVSTGVMLSILTNYVFAGIFTLFFCSVAILYILFNKPKSNVEINTVTKDKESSMRNEIEALKNARQRYLMNLGFNNDDDYYAIKAMVKALLFEKENDLTKIHNMFEGKEISDLKAQYNNQRDEVLNLQMEIDKFGPVLSPEDYIMKRRELDMLRLESSNDSNLQIDKDNIDIQIENLKSEIEKLQNQSDNNLSSPIDNYINILREYYQNENVNSDNSYNIENLEISSYEQKVELMILQRLAYIISNHPKVDLPMILEDPFMGVNNDALIKKIIDFCSKYLQVILISEHKKYLELDLTQINSGE